MRWIMIILCVQTLFGGDGWSPLHESVYAQDAQKVRGLIAKKNDINAKSDAGITPLMMAVKLNDEEILGLLLDAGADAEAQDGNGMGVLHYMVARNRVALFENLLGRGMRLDLDVQNNDGITPLMQAAYSNNMEIVETLLKFGADPRVKNANGASAYDLAYAKKNFAIASLLKHVMQ